LEVNYISIGTDGVNDGFGSEAVQSLMDLKRATVVEVKIWFSALCAAEVACTYTGSRYSSLKEADGSVVMMEDAFDPCYHLAWWLSAHRALKARYRPDVQFEHS